MSVSKFGHRFMHTLIPSRTSMNACPVRTQRSGSEEDEPDPPAGRDHVSVGTPRELVPRTVAPNGEPPIIFDSILASRPDLRITPSSPSLYLGSTHSRTRSALPTPRLGQPLGTEALVARVALPPAPTAQGQGAGVARELLFRRSPAT